MSASNDSSQNDDCMRLEELSILLDAPELRPVNSWVAILTACLLAAAWVAVVVYSVTKLMGLVGS